MKEFNLKQVLDGTPEENEYAAQSLCNTLTEEEHMRAMSDEFAYLDEE